MLMEYFTDEATRGVGRIDANTIELKNCRTLNVVMLIFHFFNSIQIPKIFRSH